MGTRSNIRSGDKSIYCHWDGYPSHNGKILLEFYNTDEKVNELLSLGNISSLREKLKPEDGQEHDFDNPAKNVTIAYHRDRGEPLEFWTEGCGEDYFYVFHESEWYFKSTYDDDDYYNLKDYFDNIDEDGNLKVYDGDENVIEDRTVNIRQLKYPLEK